MRLYLGWLLAMGAAVGAAAIERRVRAKAAERAAEPPRISAECWMEGSRDGEVWVRSIQLPMFEAPGAAAVSMAVPLQAMALTRLACAVGRDASRPGDSGGTVPARPPR